MSRLRLRYVGFKAGVKNLLTDTDQALSNWIWIELDFWILDIIRLPMSINNTKIALQSAVEKSITALFYLWYYYTVNSSNSINAGNKTVTKMRIFTLY